MAIRGGSASTRAFNRLRTVGLLRGTPLLSATVLKRAVWEKMEKTLCGDGIHVNVINRSYAPDDQNVYTVTLDVEGVPIACTCPFDVNVPEQVCKHRVFVARDESLVATARSVQATIRKAQGGAAESETMADRLRTDGGEVREEPNVSGPHRGRDGADVYTFWRCENCGLETVDADVKSGCWRCIN